MLLRRLILFCLLPAFIPATASAGRTLTVAVAANALRPAQEIAKEYAEAEGVEVRLVSGSTGKLYAQIVQGAPFDVFLAADSLSPGLLEEKGFIREGSRTTFTRGLLALWSPREDLHLDVRGLKALKDESVGRVSLASPKIAPYGRAAMQALNHAGIAGDIEEKLVFGESVSQALGFARSGNADVAIVALSTVYGIEGEHFPLTTDLYSPIDQQLVILDGAPASAGKFVDFLMGPRGQAVLKKYGYLPPAAPSAPAAKTASNDK
jgi:molybdate transport system substrate-binding protein